MLIGVLVGCAHAPAVRSGTPARVAVALQPVGSRPLGLGTLSALDLTFEALPIDALPVATWPRTAGGWRWPVDGTITSTFGPRWGRLHGGIDVGAPIGTPVTAPRSGTVVAAGNAGELGLRVELDHGDGWTSRYGHLSVVEVAVGEVLVGDERLGQVGATGNATGPHLHWEIYRDGIAVDPLCAFETPPPELACVIGGGS